MAFGRLDPTRRDLLLSTRWILDLQQAIAMAKARRATTARPRTETGTAASGKPGLLVPNQARASKRPRLASPDGARARRPSPRRFRPRRRGGASGAARKPTYHEAVALYERGLQALQRRDFAAAANALRSVIQQYPDERELLERARLYLKVCERELEPREPVPRTADEWVYAATVALNADQESVAVQHLQRALGENPRHDHAHYMMAVASTRRGDRAAAVEHLRHAVTLNPENRSLARQDPDLDALRELEAFRDALESPAPDADRRQARRPPATQNPALARFHRPAAARHATMIPTEGARHSCQICMS